MLVDTVIFDLDDTLYEQAEYLEGAFRKAAHYIGQRTGLKEDALLAMLLEISRQKGSDSGRIIDDALGRLRLGGEHAELVPGAVRAFASFSPNELHLYPGAKEALDFLAAKGARIGVLTDGRPEIQRAKIRALSISNYLDAVVISDEYGRERRKPDTFPYHEMLRLLRVSPGQTVFVGDNPKKDFLGARKLGIATVRVLTGEHKELSVGGEQEADYRIKNLSTLPALLDSIDRIELKRYYERVGAEETLSRTYESELPSKRFFYQERFRAIVDQMADLEGPLLDIGCGTGVYEREVSIDCVAIDLSRGFLSKARSALLEAANGQAVALVQADAEHLPFRTNSFRSILCSEVLEHLRSPHKAIDEMDRVSSFDSAWVITTPSPYSFAEAERSARLRRTRRFNDHISLLRPDALSQQFSRRGLGITSLKSTFFFPPFPVGIFNRHPELLALFRIQRVLGRLPLVKYLGWSLIYKVKPIGLQRRRPACSVGMEVLSAGAAQSGDAFGMDIRQSEVR